MTKTNFFPSEKATIETITPRNRAKIKGTLSQVGFGIVGMETDDSLKSSAVNVGYLKEAGVFTSNFNYTQYQLIVQDTKLYYSKVKFTSLTNFDASNWTEISGSGGGGSTDLEFKADTAYLINQAILNDDLLYIAKIAFTSGSTFDAADWTQLLGTGGSIGPKGDTGAQGIKGDKGDQGLAGQTGDKGDEGIQGIQGDKGDQGIEGDEGPRGNPGPTGSGGDFTNVSQWLATNSYLETNIVYDIDLLNNNSFDYYDAAIDVPAGLGAPHTNPLRIINNQKEIEEITYSGTKSNDIITTPGNNEFLDISLNENSNSPANNSGTNQIDKMVFSGFKTNLLQVASGSTINITQNSISANTGTGTPPTFSFKVVNDNTSEVLVDIVDESLANNLTASGIATSIRDTILNATSNFTSSYFNFNEYLRLTYTTFGSIPLTVTGSYEANDGINFVLNFSFLSNGNDAVDIKSLYKLLYNGTQIGDTLSVNDTTVSDPNVLIDLLIPQFNNNNSDWVASRFGFNDMVFTSNTVGSKTDTFSVTVDNQGISPSFLEGNIVAGTYSIDTVGIDATIQPTWSYSNTDSSPNLVASRSFSASQSSTQLLTSVLTNIAAIKSGYSFDGVITNANGLNTGRIDFGTETDLDHIFEIVAEDGTNLTSTDYLIVDIDGKGDVVTGTASTTSVAFPNSSSFDITSSNQTAAQVMAAVALQITNNESTYGFNVVNDTTNSKFKFTSLTDISVSSLISITENANGQTVNATDITFTTANQTQTGSAGIPEYYWNKLIVTKGEKGDMGDAGNQGNPGQTGQQGIPGEDGSQGPTGSQGDPGTQGDMGNQGNQGIQGIKGDKGVPGGTLNYNSYVDNAQYSGDTQSGATDQNGSTADYDTIIPIFEQQNTTPVSYYRIYDANELGETIRQTSITDGTIVARRKY